MYLDLGTCRYQEEQQETERKEQMAERGIDFTDSGSVTSTYLRYMYLVGTCRPLYLGTYNTRVRAPCQCSSAVLL